MTPPPPNSTLFPYTTLFRSQQIQKVVLALGDYLKAKCHACIGGTRLRDDIAKLQAGQHIVVGTPGRVYDMLCRQHLRRSEEHTSELQSRRDLVCRLLLEKKK